jgi:hypothetical protein
VVQTSHTTQAADPFCEDNWFQLECGLPDSSGENGNNKGGKRRETIGKPKDYE